jgi:hypothetical protein
MRANPMRFASVGDGPYMQVQLVRALTRHDAALEEAAAIHVDRAFLSEHAERPLSGSFANNKIAVIFLFLPPFLSWS